MNRKVFFKKSGLPALLTTLTAIPYYAFADTNSIFQPIIPQSGGCLCIGGAPDWGCVLQVIQNIINVGVALGVVFVVLSIAYGGFLFMVNSTNPENIQKGRQVMLNAVIGLVVVLSAWLVVDFIMKILYEPSTAFEGGTFGPWNSILASNGKDYCIEPKDPVPLTTGTVEILTGDAPGGNSPITPQTSGTSGGSGVGVAKGLCSDSNPACSVQALMSTGLTVPQAQAMSCIAVTESSGNPNSPNSSTGACGTFQITNKTSRSNWQNPANHGSGCSTSTSCNNARCNMQTAVIMLRKSGYQPWTGKNPNGTYWNPNAVACVQKYDPGH